MKAAGKLTTACVLIILLWIILVLRNNDQGEVTDRRQGVTSVTGRPEPLYELKINGNWHEVSADTYRRCNIGEQHPACKTLK